MEWSEVGKTISQYAPLVGMALSSPTGAAIAVGQVVADILGAKATPQDVINSFNKNQQKSAQQLQDALSNNIEFQKMCIAKIHEANQHEETEDSLYVKDMTSARQNLVNVNNSPMDNKLKFIIVISELMMLCLCLIAILFFHESLDKTSISVVGIAMGVLGKSITSKDYFYWGNPFLKK